MEGYGVKQIRFNINHPIITSKRTIQNDYDIFSFSQNQM